MILSRNSVLATLIGVAAFSALHLPEAKAQNLVMDGLYDCQRATNGRAYCRQRANRNYVPVSEEFFQRYVSARTGVPVGANTQINTQAIQIESNQQQINNTTVNIVVQNLSREAADIQGQISLLTMVVEEQRRLRTSGGGNEAVDAADETIAAIEARLVTLRQSHARRTGELSRYSTAIRPNDQDQYLTARKASEIYPKVPFYIPGTKEVGEFWVEPAVKETGEPVFNFRFIDPTSQDDRTRSSIEMTPAQLDRTQRALLKLRSWSKLAHEKKLRRTYAKRADCFPDESCPDEGQKVDGKASTEIIFQVSEDGATSGRIQRNKGRFEEGYNMSVESALLLQAYLRHVLKESRIEYEAGTQGKEDLDKIFN